MTVILENAGSTVLLEGEAAEKYLKRKAEEKAKAESEYDNEHYMSRMANAAKNDKHTNSVSKYKDLASKRTAMSAVEKELKNRAKAADDHVEAWKARLDNEEQALEKANKDLADGKDPSEVKKELDKKASVDYMNKTTEMINDTDRYINNMGNVDKNDMAAVDATARHYRKILKQQGK